jgi:hypothetical protein
MSDLLEKIALNSKLSKVRVAAVKKISQNSHYLEKIAVKCAHADAGLAAVEMLPISSLDQVIYASRNELVIAAAYKKISEAGYTYTMDPAIALVKTCTNECSMQTLANISTNPRLLEEIARNCKIHEPRKTALLRLHEIIDMYNYKQILKEIALKSSCDLTKQFAIDQLVGIIDGSEYDGILELIAKHATDPDARMKAVDLMSTFDLEKFVTSCNDLRLCYYAIDRITNTYSLRKIAMGRNPIKIRLAALGKMKSPSDIQDVALYCNDPEVALEAVERLDDEYFLNKIILEAANEDVQLAALLRVRTITKGKEYYISIANEFFPDEPMYKANGLMEEMSDLLADPKEVHTMLSNAMNEAVRGLAKESA